jgi:hypothetical protein
LTYSVKTVRVANATAAGTTPVNSAAVDTLGYESVRAIALLGTLTATQATSLTLQYSDDGSTGWTDASGVATGNAADADSNKILIADLHRPTKRYVRAVLNRGTANAVLDGILIELSCASHRPVAPDSTVSQQVIKHSAV